MHLFVPGQAFLSLGHEWSGHCCVFGTQVSPLLHCRADPLQVITHWPPRHVAVPPCGSLHGLQLEPHALLSVSLGGGQPDLSSLPFTQRWVALRHRLEQSGSLATSSTVPLQSLSSPSQISSLSALIALQPPMQPTKPGPHAPLHRASFATHCWPHRRNPPSHLKSQDLPSQVAVAWSGLGQGVQESPHEAVLLLSLHALLSHLWKPVLQSNPQVPPVQVA
jgi:hypothetical protein